ncbi:hypothetical protein ACOSQ2_000703 [Xanthoceras sorbifolium]
MIAVLANDSETLSRYTGFYKGVQSAGSAIAWQVDTHKVPLLSQLIVNWPLTTVSYPLLVVLVMLAVKDDDNSGKGAGNDSAPTSDPPIAAKWFIMNELGESTGHHFLFILYTFQANPLDFFL